MDDDVEDLPPKKATAASKGKNKSASETYVKVRSILSLSRLHSVQADDSDHSDSKLSQLEHVLKRPDTYIGSVEPITQPMWVYDQDLKSLVYRYVARSLSPLQ